MATLAARIETPTVDEYAHVPAGLSYWHHGEFGLYSKNPPLIKLWATLPLVLGLTGKLDVPKPQVPHFGWGPWLYGHQFEILNPGKILNSFFAARLMIIILSLLTAAMLFLWLRKMFDENIAIVTAAGFLLSPTVLAHAHLATVDVGAMATITVVMLLLIHMPQKISWKWGSLIGLATGLALATKFTAFLLLPAMAWIFFRYYKPNAKFLGAFVLTTLMGIWVSYGFYNRLIHFGEVELHSEKLKWMGSHLTWLTLPLPKDYILGLDAQLVDFEKGEFGSFLAGEWRSGGWWYYNIVALFSKEHLFTLMLSVFAPFALWRSSRFSNQRAWLVSRTFMVGMALPLLLVSSLNVGIRYLLPMFPLLFVALAISLNYVFENLRPRLQQVAVAVLVVGWSLSAWTTFPNFISYFNIATTTLIEPADLLLDSNVDWGQDLYRVKEIQMDDEPIGLLYFGHVSPTLYGINYKMIPDQPAIGTYVVSPNFLNGMNYLVQTPQGIWMNFDGKRISWLKKMQPTGRLGSLLVFDLRRVHQ